MEVPVRFLSCKAAVMALSLTMALPLFSADLKPSLGKEREIYSEGRGLMSEHKWSAAAKKFDRAIEEKKDFAEAYDMKGLCLFNDGKTADAVTQWKHAVYINPRLTAALLHLGRGFEALKKDDKATEAYERALGIEPMVDEGSVTEAHFYLGLLLKRLAIKKFGDKADLAPAISHLEKAVALDADYSEAHNELGRCYYLIARYPEAIEQYTLAIKTNKEYAEAWSNRGVAYWADGNWDLALSDCRHAVEIDPAFGGGHYNLAELYYARVQKLQSQDKASLIHEEAKKSIDEYQLAVGYEPKNAIFWMGLAKACKGYHDFDSAIKAAEQVLKIEKGNKEAKKFIADIKKEQKSFVDHMPKPKKKAE
jgi:tetratricopeptide (TPR) repeat protein